jgi:hypothetical protein
VEPVQRSAYRLNDSENADAGLKVKILHALVKFQTSVYLPADLGDETPRRHEGGLPCLKRAPLELGGRPPISIT